MEPQIFAALFIFALVMVITPGPNNIMLLASGVNFGARKTIPHAFGIILGVPVLTLIVGFGLGALFIEFPALHIAIKVAGILYLLFLAWKIATATEINTDVLQVKKSQPITLLQALFFQWVNPKAWIMVIGAISAYTTTNINIEILFIAFSFFSAAFISTSTWTYCGVMLSKFLTNARYRIVFNRTMGILLVLSILPMIGSAI